MSNCGEGPIQDSVDLAAARIRDRDRDPYLYERGIRVTELAEEETKMDITKREYEELKADQRLLYALQAAGVDNWPGYEEAMKAMEED